MNSYHSTTRRDNAVVLLVYAASTVTYWMLGVRFDASTYPRFMQFIDKDLLSDRLIESIWYYHAFPPLLNVFVGIGEKLFGQNAYIFFSASFHLLGLLLALSVWGLTERLTQSRGFALATTAILVFSPAYALYENWLMYTFPAATLLAVATLALQRYLDSERPAWGFAFFALLAMLALTRSLFHLAWLVLVVIVMVAMLRGRRREVLLFASLPLLFVAAWYGKNYFLFGSFSTTTMAGLGLSNITTLTVPGEELLPRVEDGTLSPLVFVSRYQDKELLFSSQDLPPTGIPVLDRVKKVTGDYNFNNLQLVELNRLYLRDGYAVLRHFPYHYVTGLRISNLLFFSPTHMNEYFSAHNRYAAEPMEQIYNPLLNGVRPGFGKIPQPHWGFNSRNVYMLEANPSYPLMALWIVVITLGYMRARASIRKDGSADRTQGIVLLFIIGNAIYVYCLATMLELGENYRYRFLVEPLFLVLTVVALQAATQRVARAVRGRPR